MQQKVVLYLPKMFGTSLVGKWLFPMVFILERLRLYICLQFSVLLYIQFKFIFGLEFFKAPWFLFPFKIMIMMKLSQWKIKLKLVLKFSTKD